jgi:predicted PurR-regulated permease PerM
MLIQYIIYLIFYEFVFLIVFSPIIIFISLLTKIDVQRGSILAIVIAIPVLIIAGIYLFFLPYLAHQISKRKVFENMEFFDGLKDTLSDIRIKLSLLPLIGKFFEYKKKN